MSVSSMNTTTYKGHLHPTNARTRNLRGSFYLRAAPSQRYYYGAVSYQGVVYNLYRVYVISTLYLCGCVDGEFYSYAQPMIKVNGTIKSVAQEQLPRDLFGLRVSINKLPFPVHDDNEWLKSLFWDPRFISTSDGSDYYGYDWGAAEKETPCGRRRRVINVVVVMPRIRCCCCR